MGDRRFWAGPSPLEGRLPTSGTDAGTPVPHPSGWNLTVGAHQSEEWVSKSVVIAGFLLRNEARSLKSVVPRERQDTYCAQALTAIS